MRLIFLLVAMTILLVGCTAAKYDSGEYTSNEFGDVNSILVVDSVDEDSEFTISILYSSSDEYQTLGTFKEGEEVVLPLSTPLIEGFKVEGGSFTLNEY